MNISSSKFSQMKKRLQFVIAFGWLKTFSEKTQTSCKYCWSVAVSAEAGGGWWSAVLHGSGLLLVLPGHGLHAGVVGPSSMGFMPWAFLQGDARSEKPNLWVQAELGWELGMMVNKAVVVLDGCRNQKLGKWIPLLVKEKLHIGRFEWISLELILLNLHAFFWSVHSYFFNIHITFQY